MINSTARLDDLHREATKLGLCGNESTVEQTITVLPSECSGYFVLERKSASI